MLLTLKIPYAFLINVITVFIIESYQLVRACIKAVLANRSDIKVIGDAEGAETALKQLDYCNPDILILDVDIAGMGCIEMSHHLKRFYPKVKIIVLATLAHQLFPRRLLDIGISGFLLKSDLNPKQFLNTIKEIYAGKLCISTRIKEMLFLHNACKTNCEFEQLSDRELQIMLLIIHGQSQNSIAKKLGLKSKTINSHRYRIFEKLNVNSDVELTHFAIKKGVLDVAKVE